MKNILITTDFSSAADNAAGYALEVARSMGSSVTLLHVFSLPTSVNCAPLNIASIKEMRRSAQDRLINLSNNYALKFPEVKINRELIIGNSSAEISEYAFKNGFDLIVMGGCEGKSLLHHETGSTTTAIIQNAHCPVLIVPRHEIFKIPKVLALACDQYKTINATTLSPLYQLVNAFQTKLIVANISVAQAESAAHKELVSFIHPALTTNHQPTKIINAEFQKDSEAILNLVSSEKVDMLIMTTNPKEWSDHLPVGANPKHIASHTQVPLLTLPVISQSHPVSHLKPYYYEQQQIEY